MDSLITRVALLAAATTLAAGAATAEAKTPFLQKGKFRVQVEGVQKTTWQHQHVKQFECDSNSVGSGTEKVRFKSKPEVVSIYKFGRSTPVVMQGKKGNPILDLRSKITRNGTRTESGARVCSYGDGNGTAPKAPDCGTKRSVLYAELDYVFGRRDVIGLEQSLAVPLGPFYNCPVGGTAWPSLLDRDVKSSKTIGTRLPARDLFRYGKHIVIGKGREKQTGAEDSSTTTIRWELTLTRLGKKGKR
jgi:hypothetical protein